MCDCVYILHVVNVCALLVKGHIICSRHPSSVLLFMFVIVVVLVVNDEMDPDTTCLYVHISNITYTNVHYTFSITHADRSPIPIKHNILSTPKFI